MITREQVNVLSGVKVIDNAGEKIGSVGQIYIDESNGEPAWVAVRTGMFGTNESFAPLDHDATLTDDGTLRLSASKEQVKDAPQVEPESGHLSERSAAELYRYYNMPAEKRLGETGDLGDKSRNVGRTGTAPQTQQMADKGRNLNLTRYEEQLRVGKEQVETGRVRLRKHVVTEEVTMRVPVSHEEVHIEREAVTTGTAVQGEHEFADESAEVTLHAERPVVSKETVPVERVKLSKETLTEEQPVQGTVRKEIIDIDDDSARNRKPPKR